MNRHAAFLAIIAGLAVASCATSHATTWEELAVPHTAADPAPSAPAVEPATVSPTPRAHAVAVAPAPVPAPAPPTPDARVEGDVQFGGHSLVDDGSFRVTALALVCLADPKGLTDTSDSMARLNAAVARAGVTTGDLRLVQFVRDPARSLSDPPPRVCRDVAVRVEVKAPLSVQQERAATWWITLSRDGVVNDTARAVARARLRGLVVVVPPRALLNAQGQVIAIAVASGGDTTDATAWAPTAHGVP